MTALTSLLVLATLFTQVSASLPKTSYFKMVDIWLLFCIILIFLIILFHTVIDLHVDYGDSEGVSPKSSSKSSVAWDKPSSGRAGHLTTVKVSPALNDGTDPTVSSKNIQFSWRLLLTKLDLQFYIKASKITISLIFMVFNLVYWGTLTVGSGLVYFS